MDDERAQYGWNKLAEYLGCSVAKLRMKREDLVRAGIAIPVHSGRPPRKTIMWFPSDVRRYLGILASRGENF